MNDIWQDLLHARADVTLAIGFVLAVGVTIHILLRKREVAQQVGFVLLMLLMVYALYNDLVRLDAFKFFR